VDFIERDALPAPYLVLPKSPRFPVTSSLRYYFIYGFQVQGFRFQVPSSKFTSASLRWLKNNYLRFAPVIKKRFPEGVLRTGYRSPSPLQRSPSDKSPSLLVTSILRYAGLFREYCDTNGLYRSMGIACPAKFAAVNEGGVMDSRFFARDYYFTYRI